MHLNPISISPPVRSTPLITAGWQELAEELAGVSVFAVSGDVDLMVEIVAGYMQHH